MSNAHDMTDLIRQATGRQPEPEPEVDVARLARELEVPEDKVREALGIEAPRVDPALFDGGARPGPPEPEQPDPSRLLRAGVRRMRASGGAQVDLNQVANTLERNEGI